MNLVLFHPRVSPPPPSVGPSTLDAMLAAHKARQARFSAAVAGEKARLHAISEEARQTRERNEKVALARLEAIRAEYARAGAERTAALALQSPDMHSVTYPSIRKIIAAVAQAYGVRPIDMISARRTKEVVRPRQIAMYLAKVTTIKSLPDIGRQFGKDHTTIMHGVRKIGALMAVDDGFRARVETLRAELTQP